MKGSMNAFGKRLEAVVTYVAVSMCIISVFAASVDVVTRQAGGAALAWAQRLAVWSTVTFAMLMAGNQVQENAHISIDIVFKRLSGRTKKIIDIVNKTALMGFALLLSLAGINYIFELFSSGVTRLLGTYYLPFWIVILITIEIGSIILLLYSILSLINIIKTPFNQAKEEV